jgi:GNAT superfamily N-acetyltransferase
VLSAYAPARMSTRPSTSIERGRAEDLSDVCVALVQAFHDDPVAGWVIPDADQRGAVLRGRFELLVEAFLRKGEVYVLEDRSGAALVVPPGVALIAEGEAEAFGERLEKVSGENAARFFELDTRKRERFPEAPCFYLALMGVIPEQQGRGLGAALLATVLQRCDVNRTPAYLEATSASSRGLYERHGFERVGEIVMSDGPSLWPMWREPVLT